jgi:predicted methyltransferase
MFGINADAVVAKEAVAVGFKFCANEAVNANNAYDAVAV